jgi:hypothetical protein
MRPNTHIDVKVKRDAGRHVKLSFGAALVHPAGLPHVRLATQLPIKWRCTEIATSFARQR